MHYRGRRLSQSEKPVEDIGELVHVDDLEIQEKAIVANDSVTLDHLWGLLIESDNRVKLARSRAHVDIRG